MNTPCALPVDVSDEEQDALLQNVSRTFALTIPLLPRSLRWVVTNAYLLCRIADTIEDESAMSFEQKSHFQAWLCRIVETGDEAASFARQLAPLLTADASPDEVILIQSMPKVIAVTMRLEVAQKTALLHCLDTMCAGMPEYDRHTSIEGLENQQSMDRYCYYVAGVVGEMLTVFFCSHSPEIARQKQGLMARALSFGQGLQMVNILKDFWEDRTRGVCWLPRDTFKQAGLSLMHADAPDSENTFARVYAQLIGKAHGHLLNGLDYVLHVPSRDAGVRRFCLLALALAVQTLHRIHRKPHFKAGKEVKISRATVAKTLLKVRLLAADDSALKRWFKRLGRELPLESQPLCKAAVVASSTSTM